MQHDMVEKKYLEYLEKNIEFYDGRIASIRNSVDQLENLAKDERITLKMMEKKKEEAVQALEEVKMKGMEEDQVLDDLSDKIDTIVDKEVANTEKIDKLQKLKENTTKRTREKFIDMLIQKETNKLEANVRTEIKVNDRQQAILINKAQKKSFLKDMSTKYEARKEVEKEMQEEKIEDIAEKIETNNEVKETLDPENSIADNILDKALDVQNKWYIKKQERATAILEAMNKGEGCSYLGAVSKVYSQKALEQAGKALEIIRMNLTGPQEKVEESGPVKAA
ncbi:MAG: hypothetical protein IJH18_01095 [Bacilli bacterium]|nr:hypothetical protein [Bacilli bacterium]